VESPAAEVAFRREIAPWALLGLTLGLVEGATAAVLIKKTFADAADPWMVNLAAYSPCRTMSVTTWTLRDVAF
jgi:hypothetical protein